MLVIKKFNFNQMFSAVLANDISETDCLIMHILQGELTPGQIATIIQQCAVFEDEKNDTPEISCLIVIRAILYQEGLGGAVNLQQAGHWLERGIKLQNSLACTRRAILYQQQPNHKLYYGRINRLLRTAIKGNENDATALLTLAQVYRQAKQSHQALNLLQQASALNHAVAKSELAWFYFEEYSDAPNFVEITKLLIESAQMGCKLALERLAFLCHDCKGYNRDDAQAAELYRQSHQISPIAAEKLRLEEFYRQTENITAKYHLLMILHPNNLEQEVLPLFASLPSTFMLHLLQDKFLNMEEKYYYLKQIMFFCAEKYTTLRTLMDNDEKNSDNTEAKNAFAQFCLLRMELPIVHGEGEVNYMLDLLAQVSADCNYYRQILVAKCDLLFVCFDPEQFDKHEQVLLLAQINSTHEMILRLHYRELQYRQQLMLAFSINRHPEHRKHLIYVRKTMGNINRILSHRGAVEELHINTNLALNWQEDWDDIDINLLIYLERKKIIDNLIPGLKNYYFYAQKMLLDLLEKINKEWPSRGLFNKCPTVVKAIRAIIKELPGFAWQELKILDAILRINNLASANLCRDKKHKKNQFLVDILISIQEISLRVFAKPEKALHIKGNSLPILH